jgi:hypothetical protein
MKGQRKPNPSESQPQLEATTIKSPVVTRGTVMKRQPDYQVPGRRDTQLLISGTENVVPGTGGGISLKLFSQ